MTLSFLILPTSYGLKCSVGRALRRQWKKMKKSLNFETTEKAKRNIPTIFFQDDKQYIIKQTVSWSHWSVSDVPFFLKNKIRMFTLPIRNYINNINVSKKTYSDPIPIKLFEKNSSKTNIRKIFIRTVNNLNEN